MNPKYRMIYIPQAICYTECPETWRDLFKQRIRWQKAFIDCIIRYSGTVINTAFSRSVSFFMIFDALIVGTLTSYVATACLIAFLFLPIPSYAALLLMYSITINIIWNVIALIKAINNGQLYKKKDTFRIALTIILDVTFFNLLRCFYVMAGTILYFFNQTNWNKVQRTGTAYAIETAPIYESIPISIIVPPTAATIDGLASNGERNEEYQGAVNAT